MGGAQSGSGEFCSAHEEQPELPGRRLSRAERAGLPALCCRIEQLWREHTAELEQARVQAEQAVAAVQGEMQLQVDALRAERAVVEQRAGELQQRLGR